MSMETLQVSPQTSWETQGEWATEDLALAEFDDRVNQSKAFQSFPQVEGFQSQPRFGADPKEKLIIDRILVPTRRLKDAGWKYGCVGIEGKAPRHKIGPVVCQCMDYGRTVWKLPDSGGVAVMTPWIFIWCLQDFGNDIASVMAQHRIGGAWGHGRTILALKSSGGTLLRVDHDYNIVVADVRCGLKVGSR